MGDSLPESGKTTEVLVVSLESAAARRAAFAARAADTSLVWRFFDACTGPAPGMTIDEPAIRSNKGRPMSKGEIGCYASHFSIWQDMVARGVRQAIVLEDDTVVDWAYLEPLARTDLHAEGIDYLRLYAKRPTWQRVVRRDFLQHSRAIVELVGLAYGTQGYAITLEGARRLAGHCRTVRRPIDDEMDRSWAHGLPNLALYPAPILEAAIVSDIGNSRFGPKTDPLYHSMRQRVWRQVERARMRMLKARRLLER
ncbi:Glycosyltransferase family 25 (LPS biosynthesis protein) [Sphingopyxis sp. LC81]|uniref:glycosyltransferase family 25 protein n=1 Tax=Sphingopyxis sp. LC81 TaxID=1502850 RepID=UPI00050F3D8E|nr:glycosyltransferase family 25 protein [Sphingopyxis sp. LC81]KGB53113.1 Glycosyltransferase family 25 (LPS biosynthesis protein) [Sphingopyxis sp. LC81]